MGRIKKKPTDIPAALAHIEGMNVKAILRRRGVYLKQRQNLELKEAAIPIAAEVLKKVKGKKAKAVVEVVPPQKYMSFTDAVVEAYKTKTIHNVEILEERFDKAISNFLVNTLMTKVLENLSAAVANAGKSNKKATTKMAFNAEDKAYLINQAKIQLEPYLQSMAVIAGNDAMKLVDADDDPYLPSEALRKRIGGNVSKFSQSMVDTDQDHLSSIIAAGIDEGKGVPEISAAIKSDFTEYSAMQATRITRTEVLRSANQSAVDAFKQSGVVEGKQWVIAGAEDECADYDGDVVTLEGNFYGADNEFQDGDPPLHPNCKCIVIPVVENADESS